MRRKVQNHKHELKQKGFRKGSACLDWIFLVYECKRPHFDGCDYTIIVLREGTGKDVSYEIDWTMSRTG